MIVYLDTSALVKRYVKEPYSEDILSLWRRCSFVVTSSIAYAETLAVFSRKRQELRHESRARLGAVYNAFVEDWKTLIRVDVTDALNEYVDHVLGSHPLRGFDAIHLASALIVSEKLSEEFLFACFDHRLVQAAKAFGLETVSGE